MSNPHFETLDGWEAAAQRIGYRPRVPERTAGHALESLSLFVMDHKMREVPPERRALEAWYGVFSFSQSRPGAAEARRAALETSYGSDPRPAEVQGSEARTYERGPELPPDDPDSPMPAVVVWARDEDFFLVASETLAVEELLVIARSVR